LAESIPICEKRVDDIVIEGLHFLLATAFPQCRRMILTALPVEGKESPREAPHLSEVGLACYRSAHVVMDEVLGIFVADSGVESLQHDAPHRIRLPLLLLMERSADLLGVHAVVE